MVAHSSSKAVQRAKKNEAPRAANSSSSRHPVSFRMDRQTVLLCLALVGAVFACYYPVVHNKFVHLDDDQYITDNLHVKSGLSWTTVKWAFTSFDQANWHPLTWLSHALDCTLFGLNPAGHHLVNVALHAANAVLLFLLLQKSTGFRWRSLMVAALFALHPINVESVAWAAERKNVLSMFFFLLAFYAYVGYTRKPDIGRYVAVAACYALALMAKPQVITFPFLLLLWDYWPLGRLDFSDNSRSAAEGSASRLWRLVIEKVPLLLLSAASAVLTMQAQKVGGAVRSLTRYRFPVRVETIVVSYALYLRDAIWPTRLAVMYVHPTKLYPVWQMGLAVVLLLLVTVLAFQRASGKRYLVAGWLWFLGSMVPMIGLVQVGDQSMADRYAYIPFIGLFMMVVWLVADWANTLRISARWLAIPAFGCLLAFAALTYTQISYWHYTDTLWEHTLAVTDDNWYAQRALARFLHNHGKLDEAAYHALAVLEALPDDPTAGLILGDYERGRGNFAAAIDRYRNVALTADYPTDRARAYASMGSTYLQMGDPTKAKEALDSSLQLLPEPFVMVLLGVTEQKQGDLDAAIREYSRAVAAGPTDVECLLLSQALRKAGRTDEAKAAFERAARLSRNLAAAEKQANDLLAGK